MATHLVSYEPGSGLDEPIGLEFNGNTIVFQTPGSWWKQELERIVVGEKINKFGNPTGVKHYGQRVVWVKDEERNATLEPPETSKWLTSAQLAELRSNPKYAKFQSSLRVATEDFRIHQRKVAEVLSERQAEIARIKSKLDDDKRRLEAAHAAELEAIRAEHEARRARIAEQLGEDAPEGEPAARQRKARRSESAI